MDNTIVESMLAAGRKSAKDNPHVCNNFLIMESPFTLEHIFLRYTENNVENPDMPIRTYVWLCFDQSGNQLNCKPIFDTQADRNRFFGSMAVVKSFEWI